MAQAVSNRPTASIGREFDPRDYIRILRRRYPYLIVPAVLVSAVVYWIAITLPPVYEARATILVESQLIPTNLARSTVTANADERIQSIQQRLMTRDNILTIARKYRLYSDQPSLSPTDIVDRVQVGDEDPSDRRGQPDPAKQRRRHRLHRLLQRFATLRRRRRSPTNSSARSWNRTSRRAPRAPRRPASSSTSR